MAGRIQVPLTEPRLAEQRTSNGAVQVACRLCGQVFNNSVALVNHIDMHVLRDMALSRRAGDFSLFQVPGILPPYTARPTDKLMPRGPSFARGKDDAAPPISQNHITAPPRNLWIASPQLASPDYIFRSRPMTLSPTPARPIYIDEAGGDRTRPLLHQLDSPISDRWGIERANYSSKTEETSLVPLDLTLKL